MTWRVCKRHGVWRVYDGNSWHESWPTLPEAHTAAMQLAITRDIFKPGGVAAARACVDWASKHLIDQAMKSLGWDR